MAQHPQGGGMGVASADTSSKTGSIYPVHASRLGIRAPEPKPWVVDLIRDPPLRQTSYSRQKIVRVHKGGGGGNKNAGVPQLVGEIRRLI